jgi:vacuolar-type H+-ATPase subunit H
MADANLPEELAAQAAEAVRRAVIGATERAEQVVREAEAEAARIRERAESEAAQIRERAEQDARDQIEAARRALDELGGSLAPAVSAATPGAPQAETEPEPTPEPAPEPEPVQPAESPGAPEAPVSPPAPEPEQPTVETSESAGNGDDAAVRLVAMKLAVEGKDPAAMEAELVEKFGPGDRSTLLREVLARVRD